MTHPIPLVDSGTWIRVGRSVAGYVFSVNADGSLEVGYHQNGIKAVKETVVWDGEHWDFKYSGPNATYLRGPEEAIVKRGPRGWPCTRHGTRRQADAGGYVKSSSAKWTSFDGLPYKIDMDLRRFGRIRMNPESSYRQGLSEALQNIGVPQLACANWPLGREDTEWQQIEALAQVRDRQIEMRAIRRVPIVKEDRCRLMRALRVNRWEEQGADPP